MKVNKDRIHEVLKLYRPEARVLVDAELEYPVFRGEFNLPPTFYTISPAEHAADIEIQLCINQLAYLGVAEGIRTQSFSELEGLKFEELQKEGCLIIESRKRFRRPIRTDLPIRGEIRIEDFRDYGKLILGRAKFDFESKSCIGELTLALVKQKTSI